MRDPWLVGVCVSRVLLYATYMVYAACLAVVRVEWQITAARAALVATGFTFAYAISLVAFSALADRVGARRVAVWSAWASGAAALIFALGARSFASTLALYPLVGLAQGGLYTPLIMLMADRYAPSERGRAVGWLISSTSIGYAASLVLAGAALAWSGYRLAFALTGVLTAIGTLVLVFALRETPNRVSTHAPASRATAVLRQPGAARLLIVGYTAHSWELLGMWAWMPAFLTAALAGTHGQVTEVANRGAYLGASLHVLGAISAATMGRLSDRWGRQRVLTLLALMSTCLSLAIGWAVHWPLWILGALAIAYSFSALGDSPVLSAAITEAVGPGGLGTVLGVRSLLGFGAGAIAPWVFGLVLDASNPGTQSPHLWGWAFTVLGLGGVVATMCAWKLPALPGGDRR